ncbi:hypothetical protein [Ruminococcus sp.]|uniref:hypothetical protein n=1 Tax=Ruminococcus sp. TaxID=41978 RepID=UPI0025CD43E3|nr:hypothetical protein [Ruminococcus sp.]MBQ8965896.1 hypothetical protein [Ruminococcus sp.]
MKNSRTYNNIGAQTAAIILAFLILAPRGLTTDELLDKLYNCGFAKVKKAHYRTGLKKAIRATAVTSSTPYAI